jgi:phosphohistidine phosphatase
MRVGLFRHGPAGKRDASRWRDDAQRPLTARGEARTRAASRGLERLIADRVSVVATSPYERAARTARLAADALGCERIETLDVLIPGAATLRALRAITALASKGVVVVVGHEPDLGKLAGTMVFGDGSHLPLKKAGACAIDFTENPASGQGTLAWLVPPRVLRRLGRRPGKRKAS